MLVYVLIIRKSVLSDVSFSNMFKYERDYYRCPSDGLCVGVGVALRLSCTLLQRVLTILYFPKDRMPKESQSFGEDQKEVVSLCKERSDS